MKNGISQYQRIAFVLALILFFTLQINITITPFLQRSLPIEADDAYSYILKAEELQTCLAQDCRALQELHPQLTYPSNNEDVALQQLRQYQRIFYFYHPLHTAVLTLLNFIGFTYEVGYTLIAIIFKLLLCTGIVVWLQSLFDQRTVTLSLLLLAPVTLAGSGIHTIVPSSMALAIALFAWSIALRRHARTEAMLTLAFLLMIFTHPIGNIYAGITWVLYASINFPFTPKQRWFAFGAPLLIGTSLVLPRFIPYLGLDFTITDFYPGEWSLLENLWTGHAVTPGIIAMWQGGFGFPIVGWLLASAGIYFLWRTRQRKGLMMLLAVALLLIPGILYVVPWWDAVMFERIWVPVALFLTATVSFAVTQSWTFLTSIKRAMPNLESVKTAAKHIKAVNLLALAVIGLFCIGLTTYLPFYARHYRLTYENLVERQNLWINIEQAEWLEKSAAAGSTLFFEEFPLYYFLTNGGFQRGAVYYPAIEGSEQETVWLRTADNQPNYMVAGNPMFRNLAQNWSQIELKGTSTLSTNFVELYFKNRGEASTLSTTWQLSDGGTQSVEETIPSGYDGWFTLSAPAKASLVAIRNVSSSQLNVEGLRFDRGASTYWPWESGVEITITSPEAEPRTMLISTDILQRGLGQDIAILDDQGYTVLAEIQP